MLVKEGLEDRGWEHWCRKGWRRGLLHWSLVYERGVQLEMIDRRSMAAVLLLDATWGLRHWGRHVRGMAKRQLAMERGYEMWREKSVSGLFRAWIRFHSSHSAALSEVCMLREVGLKSALLFFMTYVFYKRQMKAAGDHYAALARGKGWRQIRGRGAIEVAYESQCGIGSHHYRTKYLNYSLKQWSKSTPAPNKPMEALIERRKTKLGRVGLGKWVFYAAECISGERQGALGDAGWKGYHRRNVLVRLQREVAFMECHDVALTRGYVSLKTRSLRGWREFTADRHMQDMNVADTTEAYLRLLLRRWQRYGSETAYRRSMMRRGKGYLESWIFNSAYHTLGYHAQSKLEVDSKQIFAIASYLRHVRLKALKIWLLRHRVVTQMHRITEKLLQKSNGKTARKSKAEALIQWLAHSTSRSFREAAWYRVLDFLTRFSLMCWRSSLRIRGKQSAFVRKSLNYWIHSESAKSFLKLRLLTRQSLAFLEQSAYDSLLLLRMKRGWLKWVLYVDTRASHYISTEKAMLRWLLTQVLGSFQRWREEAKYAKLSSIGERCLNRPFTVWRNHARLLRDENLRLLLLGSKDVHLSTATRWWTSMSAERKAEQALLYEPCIAFFFIHCLYTTM